MDALIAAQEVGKEIRGLKKQYGDRIVSDRGFSASVLQDGLMPRFPLETPWLVSVVSHGLVEEIVRAKKWRGTESSLLDIASRLARDDKLDGSTAIWAVSAWAIGLEILKKPLEAPVVLAPPSPSTYPPPPPPHPYHHPPARPPLPCPPPPPPSTRLPPPTQNPPPRKKSHAFRKLVFLGALAGIIYYGHQEGWWEQLKQQYLSPSEQTRSRPSQTPPKEPSARFKATPRSEPKPQPFRDTGGNLTIYVTTRGLELNDQPVTATELENRLKQAFANNPARMIKIGYDEHCPPEILEAVKDACRKAGFKRLFAEKTGFD